MSGCAQLPVTPHICESSTVKVLYLFPDTNVFFQCKPLEQVDWSPFGTWDSIQVVLTRPVQAEIDAFKGKGNGRQAARARTASSLIRQLLDAEDECMTLRAGPKVVICLRHSLRRDDSVAKELNYDERDDQLVGIALAFKKSNPAEDVRLLTNDTGPMASAKAVGLSYHVVPQEWLLQPETEEAEKREKALKAELSKYKSAEPSFEIKINSSKEKAFEANLTAHTSLTRERVGQLVARLSARNQIATDFGAAEKQEREIGGGVSLSGLYGKFGPAKEVFEPATPEQIKKYKAAYSEWAQNCEKVLSGLAKTLNSRMEWPELAVSIDNAGSRPANDALVVLQVEGSFYLVPKKHKDDAAGEEDEDEDMGDTAKANNLRLPPPPSPPKGAWKRVNLFSNGLGASAQLQAILGRVQQHELLAPRDFKMPVTRDPNGIYFKKGRAGVPYQRVEFTCEQWRHANGPECFEMEIRCPLKKGTHSGLLTVTVHASNLTEPEVFSLPLRAVVEERSLSRSG